MAERGSDKLMRDGILSSDEIDRLWETLDKDDLTQIVDWWIKGQPHPELIVGKVKVKPGQVGEVVDKLLEFEKLRLHLKVFPNGFPFPDEVLIGFERGIPGA